MSQLFASGGQLQHQSFQWTPRTYLLQDGLVGSPWSPRDSQKSSPTPQFKSINYLVLSFLYSATLTSIHDYWKNIALTRRTFVAKVMSLLFNMLSRLVISFLPRSKCLFILWLRSPSAVILEPKKIKPATVCTVSPSICHEVMGPDAMIFVFWMLSFKPTFHSPLSLLSINVYANKCIYEINVYAKQKQTHRCRKQTSIYQRGENKEGQEGMWD